MVKINLKVEHLLIAILIFIGLYLLMGQCNCEGFSVGAPFVCDTTTYKCIENISSSEDPSLDWATDVHLKPLNWSSQEECEEICKEDKYACLEYKYTCHLDLSGTETKAKCDEDCEENIEETLIDEFKEIVDEINGNDLELSNLLKDLEDLNCLQKQMEQQREEQREELAGMKLSALKERAKEAGANIAELKEADDADDVNATLIELIIRKMREGEGVGPVFGEDAWEDMLTENTINFTVPEKKKWKKSTEFGYGKVYRIAVPLKEIKGYEEDNRILYPIVGLRQDMDVDPPREAEKILAGPGKKIVVKVPPVIGDEVFKEGVTEHLKEQIKEKLEECLQEFFKYEKKKQEENIMKLYYIFLNKSSSLVINTDDLLEKIGNYSVALLSAPTPPPAPAPTPPPAPAPTPPPAPSPKPVPSFDPSDMFG